MTGFEIDPWSMAAVEQNRRWLTAYLLAGCGDRWVAEDLVQEVFRIAYEKRGTFSAGTNFRAWLRAIAQNCLMQHFDRVRQRPILVGDAVRHLDEAALKSEDPLTDPEWNQLRVDALQACLRSLTQRVRDLVLLRYQKGLSTREVSTSCGMSVSAVDVAVFRARSALMECLKRKLAHESPR